MEKVLELLKKMLSTSFGSIVFITGLFSLGLAQVYIRVESTLIGYELGKLKQEELSLLEKRSELQMTLSKLNSKQHLQFISSLRDNMKTKSKKSLAMREKD